VYQSNILLLLAAAVVQAAAAAVQVDIALVLCF
jgi:hypothetical protein